MNTATFEQAREQIKSYLPTYLAQHNIDSRKKFRCINPAHPDKNPSAGLIKDCPSLIHCFACGTTSDIFDAANFLENKPVSGRGFITENLMYLAQKFGVVLPEMDLSDEELKEMEARRAYAQAARIVQTSKRSDVVEEKLKVYGWGEDVIQKLAIGTVESYESYIEKMTKVHGHSLEFLMEIDLAGQDKDTRRHRRHALFQQDNLIYTIRDPYGAPIAFSARNLRFEQQKEESRQNAEKIKADETLSEQQKAVMLEKIWQPRKYINTKTTFLFDKSKTLLGFDEARKSSTHSLLVLEGNADWATTTAAGSKNASALCGTAFTKEHLEIVVSFGIKKLVFGLDPDAAGEKAKKRIVDIFEQFGGHPGLDVEIMTFPEGIGDPDKYIRAFGDLKKGLAEFRKFPRIDLFSWTIQQTIEEGEDPAELAIKKIPLIVNQPNNIRRLQMADRLAEATGLDKTYIRKEVLRHVDVNESKLAEEKQIVSADLVKALTKNPGNVNALVASAKARLEVIDNKKVGYDPAVVLAYTDKAFEAMESTTDLYELVTGYPLFDQIMGGIPRVGPMISIPGKPHHGKSIVIDNWIVRLLRFNRNAMIFLHHVDDSTLMRLPRILGVMSGLPSREIQKVGAHLQLPHSVDFEKKYLEAKEELREWQMEERLIMADQALLSSNIAEHESWIKSLRDKYSDRDLIVIGDNFHLFDIPDMEAGEAKTRAMSKMIANFPTKYGITTIFSMEIPKDSLRPGVRPTYTNLKNSGGISFDSKVNINVYQELQDIEEPILTWKDQRYMEEIVDEHGVTMIVERELPIVEVHVDKNKSTGVKSNLFYRLEPFSGQMEECTEAEQSHMKALRDNHKKNSQSAHGSHARQRAI